MKKKEIGTFDHVLFAIIIILSVFGVIMVFSASSPSAYHLYGDSFFFVKKQLIWTVLGFLALFVCASIDYRYYKKWSGLIWIVNIVALILVLVIGMEVKGAKRWINLGFSSVQPSEFTKVAVVIGMAAYYASFANKKQTLGNIYMPLILIVGIPCALLILQPHFSIIIILALVVFCMMLVFGVKFKFYLPIIATVVPTAVLLVILQPYRLKRITAFLDPFADKLGSGWQIVQSLYAIGSGGFTGLGLSRSRQKYLYIPEPQNDFIFSIICEELGLIGALLVILLFAILLWRCIKIAVNCQDPFGVHLAFGMTFLILVQVLLNIGVATSSIPPTGVPLPFFSAGGSSFLFQMVAMGIILNISRHSGDAGLKGKAGLQQ